MNKLSDFVRNVICAVARVAIFLLPAAGALPAYAALGSVTFMPAAPSTGTPLSGVHTFTSILTGTRVITGTTDTPTLTDCNGSVVSEGNSPITVILPANLPANCPILYTQWTDGGTINFVSGNGASLRVPSTFVGTTGQGSWALAAVVVNANGTDAQWNIYGYGN